MSRIYACCRNTLDWQLVRNKAAELVEQMVSEMPELKEMTRYPLAQNELYDVMPIRCRCVRVCVCARAPGCNKLRSPLHNVTQPTV